jgi:hypothetical protein
MWTWLWFRTWWQGWQAERRRSRAEARFEELIALQNRINTPGYRPTAGEVARFEELAAANNADIQHTKEITP